jgi:hypothetical protein
MDGIVDAVELSCAFTVRLPVQHDLETHTPSHLQRQYGHAFGFFPLFTAVQPGRKCRLNAGEVYNSLETEICFARSCIVGAASQLIAMVRSPNALSFLIHLYTQLRPKSVSGDPGATEVIKFTINKVSVGAGVAIQ